MLKPILRALSMIWAVALWCLGVYRHDFAWLTLSVVPYFTLTTFGHFLDRSS
jgi:hypothetical protein